MDRDAATTLRLLRVQWAALTGIFVLAAGAGGHALWRLSHPQTELWFLGCFAVLAFQAALSWRHLPANAEPGSTAMRSAIGMANAITLLRGFLIGLLAGFAVTQPREEMALVPAILYSANLLLDLVDGTVARATGKRSALGEVLEHELDSVGVLAATAIVVSAGTIGPWFLAVGAVRYVFLAAYGLRKRIGLPCYPIVYSKSGRVLAGIAMGFLALALWPGVPPAVVRVIGVPVTVFFLAGFLRDWLVVCGRRAGIPQWTAPQR